MTKLALVGASALALAAVLTRAEPAADQDRREPGSGAPPSRGARFVDAAFEAASYDAATREVDLVLATGIRVRRSWFSEELDMTPEAIDLGRAALNQLRLLFNHNQNDPIGVVFNVRLEAGHLLARARFADTPRGREFEGMVARGELTGISIGYQVRTWTLVQVEDDGHELWRATAWELLEGSLVSVPADPHAGVRSIEQVDPPGAPGANADLHEESEMIRSHPAGAPAPVAAPAAAPAPVAAAAPAALAAAPAEARTAEGLTVADVLQAQTFARAAGVDVAAIDAELTRAGATPASVNEAILAAAAARQASTAVPAGTAARALTDEGETQGRAIVDAIYSRMTMTPPTDLGRQFRGYPVAELIGLRMGMTSRDPYEVLQRAMHTTSDFPLLLEAAANKFLLANYTAAAPTYRSIAARKSFQDFKPHKFLRLGEFPALLPLGENGEIKAGTMPEGRETTSLGTKGRSVTLSRQAIINDDLGVFGDLVGSAGRAAARGENRAFFALLLANGALSDGVAMFHATHGNLAGAGGAPAIATLGAGRAAMRKQKNLAGDEFLNLTPKIFLVGPDQETLAQQLTSNVQPVIADGVNPFSGRLEVVADAEIIGNAWYLFCDPAETANFVYGYLRDQTGPTITQEKPFGVDGVALQVIHDFAVGQADFRGGYKNPGQ